MPIKKLYQEEQIDSPFGHLWHAFASNPFAVAGLWAVIFLLLLVIFGPLLAPFQPEVQNPDAILLPPSWDPAGHVSHFLGTDDLGRDLFSRILHGVRLTFGMSLIVVVCALVVGFIIGSLSGMMRGLKSSILGHLLDALLSIPSLLLAILVVAVTGPGLTNVFWAVGIALTPQFVRAIHQAVHEELQKEYVHSRPSLTARVKFKSFGMSSCLNVWDVVIIQTTIAISVAILDIAALGFLNLGAQAPSSEWGSMIFQGLSSLLIAPWTITIPGLAILFTVLSINLVGDGLRSALAPIRN